MDDNDLLLWVEGVTDLDDICSKAVPDDMKAFCKSLDELTHRPFVQIGDWKMFKLDYQEHSYNRFYLQINQYTKRPRVVIVFKRYQKDKIEPYSEDNSARLETLKSTVNVIQTTHFKKTVEIGHTKTTEEYTKTTAVPYSNFVLSI